MALKAHVELLRNQSIKQQMIMDASYWLKSVDKIGVTLHRMSQSKGGFGDMFQSWNPNQSKVAMVLVLMVRLKKVTSDLLIKSQSLSFNLYLIHL